MINCPCSTIWKETYSSPNAFKTNIKKQKQILYFKHREPGNILFRSEIQENFIFIKSPNLQSIIPPWEKKTNHFSVGAICPRLILTFNVE
jgi:hypothetical protein